MRGGEPPAAPGAPLHGDVVDEGPEVGDCRNKLHRKVVVLVELGTVPDRGGGGDGGQAED